MTRAADVASSTLPSWTTSGRPTSPNVGQMGFNTTLTKIDFWTGTAWQQL
jgi:hypothetical protein